MRSSRFWLQNTADMPHSNFHTVIERSQSSSKMMMKWLKPRLSQIQFTSGWWPQLRDVDDMQNMIKVGGQYTLPSRSTFPTSPFRCLTDLQLHPNAPKEVDWKSLFPALTALRGYNDQPANDLSQQLRILSAVNLTRFHEFHQLHTLRLQKFNDMTSQAFQQWQYANNVTDLCLSNSDHGGEEAVAQIELRHFVKLSKLQLDDFHSIMPSLMTLSCPLTYLTLRGSQKRVGHQCWDGNIKQCPVSSLASLLPLLTQMELRSMVVELFPLPPSLTFLSMLNCKVVADNVHSHTSLQTLEMTECEPRALQLHMHFPSLTSIDVDSISMQPLLPASIIHLSVRDLMKDTRPCDLHPLRLQSICMTCATKFEFCLLWLSEAMPLSTSTLRSFVLDRVVGSLQSSDRDVFLYRMPQLREMLISFANCHPALCVMKLDVEGCGDYDDTGTGGLYAHLIYPMRTRLTLAVAPL
jgi:hypothetical protein